MSAPHVPVPLNELAAAVENAVQQTLAKHGAVPIEKLWVGFVAPDAVATAESAQAVAHALTRGTGVKAEPSVAQLSAQAATGVEARAVPPHRIIGLVFAPKARPKA
jgi:hypothetical protein